MQVAGYGVQYIVRCCSVYRNGPYTATCISPLRLPHLAPLARPRRALQRAGRAAPPRPSAPPLRCLTIPSSLVVQRFSPQKANLNDILLLYQRKAGVLIVG